MQRFYRRTRHEDGLAMVWLAICAPVLFLMMGFSIDLGSWYLRAQVLQRAADASALAGASLMPNVADATLAAERNLAHNGLEHGADGIVVTMTATGDETFRVQVEDTDVPSIFSGIADLTIKRHATGQHTEPVAMGNQENRLGGGNLPKAGGVDSDDPMGYWLAINGYCAAREQGDPISSRWDANVLFDPDNPDALTNKTLCPESFDQFGVPDAVTSLANPAIVPKDNAGYSRSGYNFIVKTPSAANQVQGGNITIRVFDPGFNAGPRLPRNDINGDGDVRDDIDGDGVVDENASGAQFGLEEVGSLQRSPDRTYGQAGDEVDGRNTRMTTTFSVWDTLGTDSIDNDVEITSCRQTYGTNTPGSIGKWVPLCTVNAPSHKFRVNVITKDKEAYSWGMNAFALVAGAPSQYEADDGYVCDHEEEGGEFCPQLYGVDHLSTQIDQKPDGGGHDGIEITMLRVRPEYAGKTLRVDLFDPGEGVQRLAIGRADGNWQHASWVVSPDDDFDGPTTFDSNNAKGDRIDHEGGFPPCGIRDPDDPTETLVPCEQPYNYLLSPGRYNDRNLHVALTVPPYCNGEVDQFGNACSDRNTWETWGGRYNQYWTLEYWIYTELHPGQYSLRDRTTWSASIEGVDPVHLITGD